MSSSEEINKEITNLLNTHYEKFKSRMNNNNKNKLYSDFKKYEFSNDKNKRKQFFNIVKDWYLLIYAIDKNVFNFLYEFSSDSVPESTYKHSILNKDEWQEIERVSVSHYHFFLIELMKKKIWKKNEIKLKHEVFQKIRNNIKKNEVIGSSIIKKNGAIINLLSNKNNNKKKEACKTLLTNHKGFIHHKTGTYGFRVNSPAYTACKNTFITPTSRGGKKSTTKKTTTKKPTTKKPLKKPTTKKTTTKKPLKKPTTKKTTTKKPVKKTTTKKVSKK